MFGKNAALVSVTGSVRDRNEDNYYFDGKYKEINDLEDQRMAVDIDMSSSHTFAVFDGMGGEEAGDVASFVAANTLYAYVSENEMNEKISTRDLVERLNNAVVNEAQKRKCSMGSTAVIARIDKGFIHLINLGDSRAYLLRGDEITLLTQDHTMEANWKKLNESSGGILGEPVKGLGNQLTQFLGADEYELEPYEIRNHEIKKGDIYLLCSDGLSHFVEESTIKGILDGFGRLEKKAEKLVQTAIEKKSNDNITVLIIKF